MIDNLNRSYIKAFVGIFSLGTLVACIETSQSPTTKRTAPSISLASIAGTYKYERDCTPDGILTHAADEKTCRKSDFKIDASGNGNGRGGPTISTS